MKKKTKNRTALGLELEAAMKEVAAHRQGKIVLAGRVIEPMTAGRIKEIRKKVARSPREFERRFGVPARTIEGWEQNKKVDVAARVLLKVIENDPEAVERALAMR
jgi:putative transcriptional regulator